MMGFGSHLKIYLAFEPCDMRKSYDGLSALAEEFVAGKLREGALFVFTNKRRNRFKALYYDRSGVCVLAKRLELGTFSWPKAGEGKKTMKLTPEALGPLFDGIDLRGASMRPWYEAKS